MGGEYTTMKPLVSQAVHIGILLGLLAWMPVAIVICAIVGISDILNKLTLTMRIRCYKVFHLYFW